MSGLKIYGEHDGNTVAQMWRCMGVGSAVAGVLCADGHLGYAQPVGGVVAYESHVSISGVGFDIGCGNMAVRTDVASVDIAPRLDNIMADVSKRVSFGLGRRNAEPVDHALFDNPLWRESGVEDLKPMARAQLGTLGSGNHYIDLFEDENGWVWIGVHFGSRGLGHKTAARFLKLAGGKDGIDVPPTIVDPQTELGARYLAAMELAGRYACAGREWVVDCVRRVLGARVADSVHNHHNFAWRERHGDRDLWVVRKGATPAFPGQRGFVGGSMGDDAVIIRGIQGEEGSQSLYSTVHGAGRLYGRRAAKRTFTRNQMEAWIKQKGVRVHGGDLDESPMAYRRLSEVLACHAGTIAIEHRLRPLAVFMAGSREFDPYKD
jgi:tRNA-splicing ligase RtcB (3'-phosphate/5'-hydroxy nucleic acid ligase)